MFQPEIKTNNYSNYLTSIDTGVLCQFSDGLIINEMAYETMLSIGGKYFLPAIRNQIDGKQEILYSTTGKEQFTSAFAKMEQEQVLEIIPRLVCDILSLKEQDKLDLRNLIIDPEWMFYDQKEQRVQLIYIPGLQTVYPDEQTMEVSFRQNLSTLIIDSFSPLDFSLSILADELADQELELAYFKSYIQEDDSILENTAREPQDNTVLYLKSLDLKHPQWIKVQSTPFVIGRKSEKVDGVITESKLVSRVHCKIDKKQDSYTITDLASKNGTRVNAIRLEPELEYCIHNGDVVRIADLEFEVDWKHTGDGEVKRWNC